MTPRGARLMWMRASPEALRRSPGSVESMWSVMDVVVLSAEWAMSRRRLPIVRELGAILREAEWRSSVR